MNHEGTNVKLVPHDLSDLEGIEALVRDVHEEFGAIDALLNIAGYAEPNALLDTTNDNVKTTYMVNVFSLIVMTRECVKYMRNRPSKIVNVARPPVSRHALGGWRTRRPRRRSLRSLRRSPTNSPSTRSRSTRYRLGGAPQNSGASSRPRRIL